ncbi:MAG: hypothetical protein B6D35_14195 [Candidatus Brocadia sp. UTAMX2]|jgi:exosortase|nr:MAG: hypothetical protein B6D35_14195 [Candidatus Brocadia sp. UTAMX2]
MVNKIILQSENNMKNVIPSIGNIKHYLPWILVAALYAPVFFALYQGRWASSDYTHAYFILPVFLWLVWRKRTLLRESLQTINPPPPVRLIDGEKEGENVPRWRGCRGWKNSPPLVGGVGACPVPDTGGGSELLHLTSNFIGLFILLFGISIFVFGWRQDYIFFTTLSLIPVLYGLMLCIYGLEITKALSFPILYLILLVPLPIGIIDSITLPMRHGISIATEALLKTFQYPITREGLLLSIGNNELFIGQPCSGFRSLITMVSAGLVYVFISKTDFSKKVILASSIIPFALLGNLFRIIILCLITYYFGEAAGQGFFHNFSGIVMIVIITLGLMCLEYFLGKHRPNTSHIPLSPPHGVGQREELSPAGGGAGGGCPPLAGAQGVAITHSWRGGVDEGDELIRNKGYRNKKVYITTALLLFTIIFCFASPGANTKKTKYVSQDILSRLEIPYEMNGWHGRVVAKEWDLEDEKYYQISQYIEREFISPQGENLFFYILNASNFHTPDSCAKGAGFKTKNLLDTDFHISIPANAEDRTMKAHTFYTEKDGEGFLIIYWLCINKKMINWTEQKAKLLWFSLVNREAVGLMVRLDIPCKEDSINNSLKLAKEFITDFSQNIPLETATFIFGTN